MIPKSSKERRAHGIKHGYRSGLEERVATQLSSLSVEWEYEKHTLKYLKPAKVHRYTPDFLIRTFSGKEIWIETKGRFLSSDRVKLKLILEQYPLLDLRIVFSNSRARLNKRSATTYGDWCTKYGIKYADKLVPVEWLDE